MWYDIHREFWKMKLFLRFCDAHLNSWFFRPNCLIWESLKPY